MRFNSILVVTYGRSGSTLLQGLLNSIEGCLITGENFNFIFGLYQAFKSLKKTKKFSHADTPNQAFYGAHKIDMDSFIKNMQTTVKNIILADKIKDPDIVCYGFKEIRYLPYDNDFCVEATDFSDYLDFLNLLFPNVCFVFNTRNIDDVIKSGWWKNRDPIETTKILNQAEELFKNYHYIHPDNSFMISYEDIVSQNNNLKLLYDFIGVAYDSKSILSVLSKEHSYAPKEKKGIKLKMNPSKHWSSQLNYFNIDRLPRKVYSGIHFDFSGIAVPLKNKYKIKNIKAVTSDSIITAKLGISSPAMANKYPNIRNSSLSRFEIKGLVLNHNEDISVVVTIDDIKIKKEIEIEVGKLHVDLFKQ